MGKIPERANSRVANSGVSIPEWVIPTCINSGVANSSVCQFQRLSIFGGIQFWNGPIPGRVNARVGHFRSGSIPVLGQLQSGQFLNGPIPGCVNSRVGKIPEWANSRVVNSDVSIPGWVNSGVCQFRSGQFQRGPIPSFVDFWRHTNLEWVNSGAFQFPIGSYPEWVNSGGQLQSGQFWSGQFRRVPILERANSGVNRFRRGSITIPAYANS